MKILIILLLLAASLTAQEYKAVNIKGDVKYQSGTSEEWFEVKEGKTISSDAFVSTGAKSFVKLVGADNSILLNELSAISVASIKSMSTDELLLALAMEDMINAPKTNGKGSSNNTATYGNKENNKDVKTTVDNFGIMRLNGAVQLANSGLKESAVIFAKETYRKYPDTKQLANYRIFFADILYGKGLYEEA
ncbi:MAG: hypothetical protein WBN42_12220, partial [Ignavibacteriaceae bacterium]